jgi:hypothetical protein
LFITVDTPQLSFAIGFPKYATTAEQLPVPLLTLILAGQVITGTSLSVTVTVWMQLFVLP